MNVDFKGRLTWLRCFRRVVVRIAGRIKLLDKFNTWPLRIFLHTECKLKTEIQIYADEDSLIRFLLCWSWKPYMVE